jgi:hypothetical protein
MVKCEEWVAGRPGKSHVWASVFFGNARRVSCQGEAGKACTGGPGESWSSCSREQGGMGGMEGDIGEGLLGVRGQYLHHGSLFSIRAQSRVEAGKAASSLGPEGSGWCSRQLDRR